MLHANMPSLTVEAVDIVCVGKLVSSKANVFAHALCFIRTCRSCFAWDVRTHLAYWTSTTPSTCTCTICDLLYPESMQAFYHLRGLPHPHPPIACARAKQKPTVHELNKHFVGNPELGLVVLWMQCWFNATIYMVGWCLRALDSDICVDVSAISSSGAS